MAPTPPLPVTEDTPPDMLAGSMDLRVVLPSGHSVKMSVERSTPMMDLLVQVTTVNKISTGGHVLQAIGERGILPYKPSTPIGALDTWTIQVVPKSKVQTTTVQKKAPLKPLNQQQPFEQTFRLQVHLPRNQLFVMRVSPRTLLSDILHQTCREKNLDPNKYELRHPANLSQLLNQSCTLADYSLQEVTVVARSCAPGMGSALSSSDIMALQREEDKRRQQARQQHGTGTGLGLVFNKQSQSSVCEGSISSDSLGGRSISPARSDESASRSASPPAPSLPPMIAPLPPARPARKRRPAPKPPSSNNGPVNNKQQTESNMQAESSSGTVVNGHSGSSNTKATHVPVSHSRNSSDSSGYHEASVLSESPAEGHQMSESCTADTLPHHGRVSGQPARMRIQGGSHGLSRSMSSLTGVGSMAGCQHSTSNTSLASSTGQGQKKKKAPPPPPGAGGTKDYQQQKHLSSSSLSSTNHTITEPHNKTTSLERHLSNKSSEVGSGQQLDKCSTLPGKMKMSEGDYRPVDPPVHKSNNTPETKTLSPEENCLEKDQKIPELEDASVAYVSKETSVIHSQMHEDEHNIAAISQSSGGDIPEIQDECYQHLPVPPVETAPETHVELSARSKSPQVVDTSTPEASAVLEQEPMLHIPAPKPRLRNKPSPWDEMTSLPRKKPVPPPRQMSNSSILLSEDVSSTNAVGERQKEIANAEGSSGEWSSGKKRKGENCSVGRTFGVGTTMLMLSQSGTDSTSSGSSERHSVRSHSSADVGPDSDDDLNIADNDMEIFDVMKETSDDTIQARNSTRDNTSTLNQQLIDSHDDPESLSLASSLSEYDSEPESSEASSTLKFPPLERLMRTKGERGFGASKGGSLCMNGRNGLQEKKVVPRISGGSSTSLQSMDEVPALMESDSNSMGQWTDTESLIMEAPASKQSWVLGSDSGAESNEYAGADPVDQVEEAFRSVTAELEATMKQDEDLNTLPPPPTSISSADDVAVDWEYQLPAPPSAFRDSDSPTLTEGETVILADSQVFQEPSLSPEPHADISQAGSETMEPQESLDIHLNSLIHRNKLTRTNPLFDPHQCEDSTGDRNSKPATVSDIGKEGFKNDIKHMYHPQIGSQKLEKAEQELMKSNSWRDQRKETSTRKGVPGSGELANFTITTYQRPHDTDRLFYEDSDDNRAHTVQHLSTFKKPTTAMFQHHKYSSTSSLNSTAPNISRTNSFNNNDSGIFKPPGPFSTSVKRSTSYISLATNPSSCPGNGFQPGSTYTPYTNRTESVGNLAAEARLDPGGKREYESWSLRKTTSNCSVSQDPAECLQEGTKSQEMARGPQAGQEELRDTQQQIIITEEERARLLALQEQFLQLQEQLLQNSCLLQQQQLSEPQVHPADTPLQSLQVLRSILPQLNQTKVLSGYQAISQQQNSDNSATLRSETLPTKLVPENTTEDLSNNQSVRQTTSVTLNRQNSQEKKSNSSSSSSSKNKSSSSSSSNNSSSSKNNNNNNNNNNTDEKKYKYEGPPAINFATWSERPKSQVSIKMDRDYRIGIGQGGRVDEHNDTHTRTGLSESKGNASVVESKHHTEASLQSKNDHEEVNAQNKTNSKLNSLQEVTKTEPASLTRLISHTTASGFRKPVTGTSQKFWSSSYISGDAQQSYTSKAKEATGSSVVGLQVGSSCQQNDPSRVPIVRAVELKKSFIQQQNMHSNPHNFHSSVTLLNREGDKGHCGANMVDQKNSTVSVSRGSDTDNAVETFVGVNFLAKRFSVSGSSPNAPHSFRSTRPVSVCGKVETVDSKGLDNNTSVPYNSTLSYKSMSSANLNALNVNTYQDGQFKNGDGRGTRRYTSVIGINSDLDHSLSLSSFQEPASELSRKHPRVSAPSMVRVNGFTAPKQLMPVVKGFQFTSPATNSDISPPLSSKNLKTTNGHHPKVQRSESTSAIRSWKAVDTTDHPPAMNFGNGKTCIRQNSNESGSEPVVMKVTTTNVPEPPPLTASLCKSTAQPSPKTVPVPQLNPRDQLMEAIRNFGGRENLKQTGCS